jgi:hypothetical protein
MEPTDKSVTKIGKDSYRTKEEVEADAKKLCKEPAMVVSGGKADTARACHYVR